MFNIQRFPKLQMLKARRGAAVFNNPDTLIKPRCGVVVFENRDTLIKPDGSFDFDRAIAEGVALRNKYRQNMITLKKNTGRLPPGWEIKPFATIPPDVQDRLAKRQTEALTNQEGDEGQYRKRGKF
ncbi:hypothetical protein BDP27DRAFT_1312401 [Rhodocollybia butyracea]|uniref:Uncharacterized protein n=1 Tax=Rhodocollybia butyracea TaxID=206335 RepID=A0A9P5Q8U6_9AGAR|nr:hypothetical protein BDP27DRAFT_1312401 [Rhodocollybia butyracea]